MALSADIYQALTSDVDLTNLVPASNIFMQRRTNEVAFPSINMSQDGGTAFPTLESEADLQNPIYVSEIQARTYDEIYAIEQELTRVLVKENHATFEATRGELSSHLFDDDTKVHELLGAYSIYYGG